MKKSLLLFAIAFLFQSCYTYKQMDMDPSKMVVDHKYKIKRNHKFSKVIFKSASDSSIIVLHGWKKKEIPLKEITAIKKRKFSVIKTVALVPATAAVVAGIFILTYDGPNINLDGFTYPN